MLNDKTKLTLAVVAATALINLAFAFSGVTHSLSCTISAGIQKAYAAIVEPLSTSTPDLNSPLYAE